MAKQSKCTVKWFNVKLHYGFFTLPDGRDVLVHRTRLEADGVPLRRMQEEKPAMIEYEDSGRLWTTRVLWVGQDPAKRKLVCRKKAKAKPDLLRVGDRLSVEVCWYNSVRGFGFAKPVGLNHPDLFFHVTLVPDDLQEHLVVGTVFDAAVGENDQGLTAVIFQRHEEVLAAE